MAPFFVAGQGAAGVDLAGPRRRVKGAWGKEFRYNVHRTLCA